MSKSQTAAARAANTRRGCERAVDDPAKLARAAQIVRIALERKRLRLADLTAEPETAPEAVS